MTAPTFTSTLRTRAPWAAILPTLQRTLALTESRTAAPDLFFPAAGLAVLLLSGPDTDTDTDTVARALQSAAAVVVVVFLGGGVWEFQLLLDQRFHGETVYLVPLLAAHDLPDVLLALLRDYGGGVAAHRDSAEQWTPARMLSLMTTAGAHLSVHSTLVLHSVFPSLRALAVGADEAALEVLGRAEARAVVEFLDVEVVVG